MKEEKWKWMGKYKRLCFPLKFSEIYIPAERKNLKLSDSVSIYIYKYNTYTNHDINIRELGQRGGGRGTYMI